jgi:hypothetical protein
MHTKRRACEPRWDSFTGWSSNRVKKPRAPSWRGTLEWIEAVRSAATAEYEELLPQIAVWDAALADLGSDPCRQAWAAFRPLRLSREEDWSDWLAYLLGTDDGMVLGARLFGPDGDSAPKVVEVQREVPVAGGERRADLVLLWTSNRASHVEVKLWDTCYEKTAETAAACRLEFKRDTGWRDYVLLPDEMEKVWAESPGTDGMRVVTWSSVAVHRFRVRSWSSDSSTPRHALGWRSDTHAGPRALARSNAFGVAGSKRSSQSAGTPTRHRGRW